LAIARDKHFLSVLILDELTSSLDEGSSVLFSVIRSLCDQGLMILCHPLLDQTYEIADRITVLRNGGW
jgi:ABC-type sugar transport system ATPase subunit